MNILVLAACDGLQLDPSTAHVVKAATRLAAIADTQVHLLLIGHGLTAAATQAAQLHGVDMVLVADDPALASPGAETRARQLAAMAAGYGWVIAAHTLAARAALPRAAALCNAAYLSDVTRVDGDTLERPAYAGVVLTQVRSTALMTFLTVRASSFKPVGHAESAVAITPVPAVAPDTRTRLLSREAAASTRPDLGRAHIVVAGGRGVGSRESMARVEALADCLGAAVGASRAAVDAGFAANTVQIGQTGKTIAPQVYVALGISGAIQHLAGIKDADCIVAVNKDPDAPIFQIADYGVVGDLFDALPALQAGLPAAPVASLASAAA